MQRTTRLSTLFLYAVAFLSNCTSGSDRNKDILPISRSRPSPKPDAAIVKLGELYRVAASPNDRRSIFLKAIDEGAIHRDSPIAAVDAVVGTEFAAKLPPEGNDQNNVGIIYFVPEL